MIQHASLQEGLLETNSSTPSANAQPSMQTFHRCERVNPRDILFAIKEEIESQPFFETPSEDHGEDR